MPYGQITHIYPITQAGFTYNQSAGANWQASSLFSFTDPSAPMHMADMHHVRVNGSDDGQWWLNFYREDGSIIMAVAVDRIPYSDGNTLVFRAPGSWDYVINDTPLNHSQPIVVPAEASGGGGYTTWLNELPTGVAVVGDPLVAREYIADGTVVGTVRGIDPDVPESLTYVLLDDADGVFAIDQNGVITVVDGSRIDYEQDASMTVVVQVTDGYGATAQTSLEISVTDVALENVTGDWGTDIFVGGSDIDRLNGAGGADWLFGGGGDDLLLGGSAGDVLSGEEGLDILSGGEGADQLSGGSGDDVLLGAGGADLLDGGSGADEMIGGAGNDVYVVDDVRDQVLELSGGGADEVRTTLAEFTLATFTENLTGLSASGQTLNGNEVANAITGAGGDDRLAGAAGNDVLSGGGGLDRLDGGEGDDTLFGNGFADVLLGGGGLDLLDGGTGDDELYGNGYADRLLGGAGADRLDGGSGEDVLDGGTGDDLLTGGSGGDVFVLASGWGRDAITDFTAGSSAVDVIRFSGGVFADFAAVMAAAVDTVDGVVISSGADTLTLRGVTRAQLRAADFEFAGPPASAVPGTVEDSPRGFDQAWTPAPLVVEAPHDWML